jgi:hypothetical protein
MTPFPKGLGIELSSTEVPFFVGEGFGNGGEGDGTMVVVVGVRLAFVDYGTLGLSREGVDESDFCILAVRGRFMRVVLMGFVHDVRLFGA